MFGMRYGSIPDGYDKSMTHLEYDEAQSLKLPSLIYLLDESHPIGAGRAAVVGSSSEATGSPDAATGIAS